MARGPPWLLSSRIPGKNGRTEAPRPTGNDRSQVGVGGDQNRLPGVKDGSKEKKKTRSCGAMLHFPKLPLLSSVTRTRLFSPSLRPARARATPRAVIRQGAARPSSPPPLKQNQSAARTQPTHPSRPPAEPHIKARVPPHPRSRHISRELRDISVSFSLSRGLPSLLPPSGGSGEKKRRHVPRRRTGCSTNGTEERKARTSAGMRPRGCGLREGGATAIPPVPGWPEAAPSFLPALLLFAAAHRRGRCPFDGRLGVPKC